MDAFAEHNSALRRIPEAYESHLDHYREMLSPAQIKEMIDTAKSSIAMLQDYITFLNHEMEVSE